jgi:Asp/Glu/hydantoin racemase
MSQKPLPSTTREKKLYPLLGIDESNILTSSTVSMRFDVLRTEALRGSESQEIIEAAAETWKK